MSDIIQARYDKLEQIAARFSQASAATDDLRGQVLRAYTPLADGGWIGAGAASFCAEVEGEILPALLRLRSVLTEAQAVTNVIAARLRQAEEEAAAPFRGGAASTPPATEPGLWDRWGEWVHGALDVLGLVPVFGEVADGVNGLIYLAEGRYVEATISAVAMIPVWGDLGKAAKWTAKGGKMVVEEVAEAGAKRVLREGAEEAAERGAREGAEALRFGELAPNARYTRNGYEYATDEAGRVSQVSGTLKLETAPRTRHQTEVGHQGLPGDEGGHLIGSQFGGTPEGVNLVPQSGWLNRGKGSPWAQMERGWARNLEAGRSVKVDIQVHYPPGETVRPSRFRVAWEVDGKTYKRIFRN